MLKKLAPFGVLALVLILASCITWKRKHSHHDPDDSENPTTKAAPLQESTLTYNNTTYLASEQIVIVEKVRARIEIDFDKTSEFNELYVKKENEAFKLKNATKTLSSVLVYLDSSAGSSDEINYEVKAIANKGKEIKETLFKLKLIKRKIISEISQIKDAKVYVNDMILQGLNARIKAYHVWLRIEFDDDVAFQEAAVTNRITRFTEVKKARHDAAEFFLSTGSYKVVAFDIKVKSGTGKFLKEQSYVLTLDNPYK